MQATAERTAEHQETIGPSNLSEYLVTLEALRKRQAKHEKAAAKAAQAAAQIEATEAATEDVAKKRAAAVIAAWSRGKSELTDAERRKLDEEERSIMASAYDFDITADQLPALKEHLHQEAEALADQWRALRMIGRRLVLEDNEKSIEHHKASMSDPRGQLFEIEQHLANIRDRCAAGEYFRNNAEGRMPLGPRKAKSLIDGKMEWTDALGDPGALDAKHDVEELLDQYRKIAKVEAEVDRKHAWEIVRLYADMGVPIYTREERDLEQKTHVTPFGAQRIEKFKRGELGDNQQGTMAAAMRRRIAELEEATTTLRALQAKPF
jgi:hypothetical protein